MRLPVHGQNNFRWTLEIISLLQHKKIGPKLGDAQFRAVPQNMHFHVS